MNYWILENKTTHIFRANVPKFTNIVRPNSCTECGSLLRTSYQPEILQVKNLIPDYVPISSTNWGFGVIHIDVLSCLNSLQISQMHIGMLQIPNGNIVENFRSFTCKTRLLLRGGAESIHRRCQLCSISLYNYLPRSSPYIVGPVEVDYPMICEAESSFLLVNDNICEHLNGKYQKYIDIYEVPIVQHASDGLPTSYQLWDSI